MITDEDINKIRCVFATKEDLKFLATKKELKALDSKMDSGFQELLNFIVEVRDEIMKELNDFRVEMRDINLGNQSTFNNHEARISHFEYTKP